MGRAVDGLDAAGRLRAGGYRVTRQRRRVLEAVSQLGHATPEQLHAVVAPEADLATVYRTLALLQEAGLVEHTHFGHGSPTWSVVPDEPHLHLVCQGCDAVLEAPASAALELVRRMAEQLGFQVDVGHVSLSGRCASCGPAASLPGLARRKE